MPSNDLVVLRRKELVGTLAWLAWGLGVVVDATDIDGVLRFVSYFSAWVLTTLWVELDLGSRHRRRFGWTFLTLLTGPLGFALYYLTRQPVLPVCSRCGTTKPSAIHACPTCGYATPLGRAQSALADVYAALGNSLVRAPAAQARETAKQVSFALAAVTVIGLVMLNSPMLQGSARTLVSLIWALSAAAYWVITAWWVYLDSMWRKMDGVPWAVLTLVTNVVGLVTYLVIRYPDPRLCASCGASMPVGHKVLPLLRVGG